MQNDTLSVYIITYNRANYLESSIQSVLKQTYKDYDLFILDNCSTDSTPNVIKKFNDSRLHYIRHSKNIGGIGNIQFAIKHCTTDFMVIFHDDDIMKEDLLKREIDILSKNSNIAAVSCNANYVNEAGEKDSHTMFKCDSIKYYSSGELFRSYLTNNKWLCFPPIMYRSSFLKDNNITFQEDAGPCGDVILCCDVERYGGTICEIPDALIYYRYHTDQDSSSSIGIMQLKLCKYINSVPYYKKILDECSNAQPSFYRWCMKCVLLRAIRKTCSTKEIFKIINEFDKLLKHKLYDEILIKICIVMNGIFPRTVLFFYKFYMQVKSRRIK